MFSAATKVEKPKVDTGKSGNVCMDDSGGGGFVLIDEF